MQARKDMLLSLFNAVTPTKPITEPKLSELKAFIGVLAKPDADTQITLNTPRSALFEKNRAPGITALLFAARHNHGEIVDALLDAKADLDAYSKELDETPVIGALKFKLPDIAGKLLEAKANPDSCNDYGTSPLIFAAIDDHFELAQQLVVTAKANPDLINELGYTALSFAAENGHHRIVDLLLNVAHAKSDTRENRLRKSPLFLAVENNHEECVKLLLTAKANPDIASGTGATPLMLAAIDGKQNIAALLLAAKARTDLKALDGDTAIKFAIDYNRLSIVLMLLQHPGITIDAPKELLLFFLDLDAEHADVKKFLDPFRDALVTAIDESINCDTRKANFPTPLRKIIAKYATSPSSYALTFFKDDTMRETMLTTEAQIVARAQPGVHPR